MPHPSFGAFGKHHQEFFQAMTAEGWQPVPGYVGVEEKILSGALDPVTRTGALTRLSRWAPGAAVTHPVSHSWCEEVFIISGTLTIGTTDASANGAGSDLAAGTYAVRPDGIAHGPFFSRDGCLMIEFSYFPPSLPAATVA
ncbi:cupin [Phreatobacter aquaticus]|uniref:Cupin n=1 Tax=Phreatobacter aquaticus TaxID=2570229 RepID=A0A4D7QBM4_9HYPH|nr:cupin domain-containing protein [Phreatobacter aquaticus]QCK85440.1 cupin [Phreatobacter aquaticus]